MPGIDTKKPLVSMIHFTKNEQERLSALMKSIHDQNHRAIDVRVMDEDYIDAPVETDRSTDNQVPHSSLGQPRVDLYR